MAHNRIRRTTAAAAAVAAVALLAGVAACSSNSDEPNVTLTATGNPAFDGPDGKTGECPINGGSDLDVG